MFVIIVGGGRTGTQLASLLKNQNHRVHLIENRPEILSRLHLELPTELIVEGEPTDPGVLEHAGARQANVLVAATPNDADNLVISALARQKFSVPRIIARINDPRNAWLYTPVFSVDVALNQAEIFARLIEEEMSLGDMMTLLKLRRGNFSLVEEKIAPDAIAVGQSVKDLNLPPNCTLAAIIRHGELIVPRGDTVLEAEDEVLAVTDRPSAAQLEALFAFKNYPDRS